MPADVLQAYMGMPIRAHQGRMTLVQAQPGEGMEARGRRHFRGEQSRHFLDATEFMTSNRQEINV